MDDITSLPPEDGEPDDNTVTALVDPLETLSSTRHAQTLLPPPFASAVSLFAATSSLSLRLGSLIGNVALSVGRISTLTALELTRAALEGVLGRAGQDVVHSSRGAFGRAAAETLLERALTTLHQTITTGAFLASTGFQLGSTGISTSLAVGQTLLSALDALFGDTETSKAIATIIVLVQREAARPGVVGDGAAVTLSDLFTSVVAFALLQRWGFRRTQLENEKTGSTEVIWDIVVLAESQNIVTGENSPPHAVPTPRIPTNSEEPIRPRPRSSASFMSAFGDTNDFQGTCVDDSRSFASNLSTRQQNDWLTDGNIDASFREHIVGQLRPGTNVQVTFQSMTFNHITVEIDGDTESVPDPPQGYSLVTMDATRDNRRKLVFQSQAKKRKTTQFDVPRPVSSRRSSIRAGGSSLMLTELAAGDEIPPVRSPSPSKDDYVFLAPVQANQKRQRTSAAATQDSRISVRKAHVPEANMQAAPLQTSPVTAKTERLTNIRESLKQKKSYKNLVEFWSNTQPKKRFGDKDRSGLVELPLRSAPAASSRPSSPSRFHERLLFTSNANAATRPGSPALLRTPGIEANNTYALPTAENLAALNARERPSSRLSQYHKRTGSVYSVISMASETSLVLHTRSPETSVDAVATSLNRHGRLPGQYPSAPFAANALRYLRFSIASYGQSFLRILGTITSDQATLADPFSQDPKEHHSFSSYTRLPPSTVLLSSYVDPAGVPIAKDQPGAATVLVHYVSLDHDAKAVVLTCRGTLGVEDILTDLTADYEVFYWQGEAHHVHQGILAAARKLLTSYNGRVMATLATALEEFPDYGLVLCGHSLGGGVASVLAMLLAEPESGYNSNDRSFVTRSFTPGQKLVTDAGGEFTVLDVPFQVPAGRPVHVYAYGPAACVSPSLQRATQGLITSIVHGQDSVCYLSLGTLRDFQSVALAFKADQGHVKNEIRRRVWNGLQKAFFDRSTPGDQWLPPDALTEDQWPWLALQGLRSNLDATKLVPPGDVFHVEAQPVLQRHAFVSGSGGQPEEARTFKPAKHVTVTHIRDVEQRFREITFGASMWFDHMPTRYEAVLETLEKGLA